MQAKAEPSCSFATAGVKSKLQSENDVGDRDAQENKPMGSFAGFVNLPTINRVLLKQLAKHSTSS